MTGLSLGPLHAVLQDDIDSVQQGKAKRSMFAETQRERMEILEAIRASEWNREMNPVVASIICPEIVKHDFSSGYVVLLQEKNHILRIH